MIYYKIFLCILILKKSTTTSAITTKLEHPSHTSFRRHIGILSSNDWETGLREATYQALLRENNREPTLRDQIYSAPLEGRQDSAIPFGDIIVLAKGQLYSTYNGYKFVQDPYQNDCDDCHNGRIKCSPSQCKGWNPVTGEQLVALWTVKRIRHRDPVYGHRYELEYTLSPINAVVNSRYLLSDGGFDYNLPGHVFIVRLAPSVDKTTTKAGTTLFNSNYVNLDGKKEVQHNRSDKEIEIYKELIKSLAMKTSPVYSDIFDTSIQKIPVTMIHQEKFPSTSTTIWTTPNEETTKVIKYSEPDPLYHSTTALIPQKKLQQTSPITTITFFAPDESNTENNIFDPTEINTTTTPIQTTTTKRRPTFKTRKPFIPKRFNTTRTRKPTTTPDEFDEVFLPKITTTTAKSTTITTSTFSSIFDVSNEEEHVVTTPKNTTKMPEKVATTKTIDNNTLTTAYNIKTIKKPSNVEKSTKSLPTTTRKSITTETVEKSTKSLPTTTRKSITTETVEKSTKSLPTTTRKSITTETVEESTKPLQLTTSETIKTEETETETIKMSTTPLTTESLNYTEKYMTESSKKPLQTTATIPSYEKTETTQTLPTTTKEAYETTETINPKTTTPIVFLGTIITKPPNTTKKLITNVKQNKKEDIYDIFGEQTPTVIEKPTTEKATIADDFLFGTEIKNLPAITQESVVIFDNFFEASTTFSPNENTTQLENNTEGIIMKTEAEPLTSMSYITSISFQVNGKNLTTSEQPTMLKAQVKEITTNVSDFKVFKAEMPDLNQTNSKQQFDHIALSLINHARSIDILNNNQTKMGKQKKRRSYTSRRGRKRKVRREKMLI